MSVSKRAMKTLDLIKRGKFYMTYDDKNPATIEELKTAGLIRPSGRAMAYVAAYVPADGYVPMRQESFIGEESYKNALIEKAAPDLLEALEEAMAFIATEYQCAKSQALEGEFLSKEAREVFGNICAAIAKAKGETK